MNKPITRIPWSFIALIIFSCGQRDNTPITKVEVQVTDKPAFATKIESPNTEAIIPFFEEDYATPEPYRLCEQKLTSQKEILSEFPESTEDFFREFTPERDAFYFPKTDIKDKDLARIVQLRYNYVALFNRVLHSYEWFERMSTIP